LNRGEKKWFLFVYFGDLEGKYRDGIVQRKMTQSWTAGMPKFCTQELGRGKEKSCGRRDNIRNIQESEYQKEKMSAQEEEKGGFDATGQLERDVKWVPQARLERGLKKTPEKAGLRLNVIIRFTRKTGEGKGAGDCNQFMGGPG